MLIKVFEVYSEGGSNCVAFLTREEAEGQTLIQPSQGPYFAMVDMSEEEIKKLKTDRYLWI